MHRQGTIHMRIIQLLDTFSPLPVSDTGYTSCSQNPSQYQQHTLVVRSDKESGLGLISVGCITPVDSFVASVHSICTGRATALGSLRKKPGSYAIVTGLAPGS